MTDFAKVIETTIRDAGKLRKVMERRGLRRAKAKCPECGGWLHGRIAPNNGHLHMRCDGPCGRVMMQ